MESSNLTPRCQAEIERKDQLRRTGRGPSGFEMHYTIDQCPYRSKPNSEFCGIHGPNSRFRWAGNPRKCKWASKFIEAKSK